jgi:Family of unknown function (DUF6335)
MAKRRTGAARRKGAGGGRSRSSARKTARAGGRKTRKTVKKAARKAAARKGARAAAGKRKAAPRRAAKAPRRGTAKTSRAAVARRTTPPKTIVARKAPALDRPRRTVDDEDIVPTPPSSLDLDRTASAVRTGRREMKERTDKITQTGPALTGGDVDADWESAYSVGDEAPGGDNPTPDQDIVDDIGKAVGVEYEDNEELKGEEKIAKRDRKRWELDPASSEDYNDRD